jgi:hypothetical protein
VASATSSEKNWNLSRLSLLAVPVISMTVGDERGQPREHYYSAWRLGREPQPAQWPVKKAAAQMAARGIATAR